MKKNYKYLNNINFPSDIRKLSTEELRELSDEVRDRTDKCSFRDWRPSWSRLRCS